MLTHSQLAFVLISVAGVACAPAAGPGPSSTSAPESSAPSGGTGSAGMANMPPMSSAEMANMPPDHADGSAPANPAAAAPSAAADEMAAFEKAKPVFETYCAKCHTTQGSKSNKKSLEHFNMDSYPFGGHHAAEIGSEIREVLGASGEKATMPRDKPGAVKGAELKLVLAWADAYDRAHPATGGEHHHHGDEDSDEHEHGSDGHEGHKH